MPLIEHNAPDFFYKAFWKRDDVAQHQWNQEQIIDWRQNELVINNQPTFKRYRIKVEAHNRRGQANSAAEEVIGYSGEDGNFFNKLYCGLMYDQYASFSNLNKHVLHFVDCGILIKHD